MALPPTRSSKKHAGMSEDEGSQPADHSSREEEPAVPADLEQVPSPPMLRLLELPEELLEGVLADLLPMKDLCAIAQSCTKFRDIAVCMDPLAQPRSLRGEATPRSTPQNKKRFVAACRRVQRVFLWLCRFLLLGKASTVLSFRKSHETRPFRQDASISLGTSRP